jgi:hypothetical protein
MQHSGEEAGFEEILEAGKDPAVGLVAEGERDIQPEDTSVPVRVRLNAPESGFP